jgi:hypothetical protein
LLGVARVERVQDHPQHDRVERAWVTAMVAGA